MVSDYHIAQINIAKPLFEMESDEMSGFRNALEAVNTFAEASPGFIWRLKDEDGPGATGYDPFGDGTIINISVWEDIESLKSFVYRTGHARFIQRKAEWFPKPEKAHMALWWIHAGGTPSVDEALAKLDLIDKEGPTEQAFTFGKAFPAPAK